MGKCIITYKGKKYSEEQFKEYFINNKQEFATSIARNKDVIDSFKRKMEGIDYVFSQSPELASIGNKQQYSQYLDTIFPDSKVKDIVYRGSERGIENDNRAYLYFTSNKNEANIYAKTNFTKGGNINERNPIPSISKNIGEYIDNKYGKNSFKSLNADKQDFYEQVSENDYELRLPEWYKEVELSNEDKSLLKDFKDLKQMYDIVKIESEEDLMKQYDDTNYQNTKPKYDKLRNKLSPFFNQEQIGKVEPVILNIQNPYTEEIVQEDLQNNRDAYKNGHDGAFLMDGDHFVVKKSSEQIHILGSKQDIEGFKEFVSQDQSISEIPTLQQLLDFQPKVEMSFPLKDESLFLDAVKNSNLGEEVKEQVTTVVEENMPKAYLKVKTENLQETLAELSKILPQDYFSTGDTVNIDGEDYTDISISHPSLSVEKTELPDTSLKKSDEALIKKFSTFFSFENDKRGKKLKELERYLFENIFNKFGIDVVTNLSEINRQLDNLVTRGILREDYRQKIFAFAELMVTGNHTARVFVKENQYSTRQLFEEAGHIFIYWMQQYKVDIGGENFKLWEIPASGVDYLKHTPEYQANYNTAFEEYKNRIREKIDELHRFQEEYKSPNIENYRKDIIEAQLLDPSNVELLGLSIEDVSNMAQRLARIEIAGQILGSALQADVEGKVYTSKASKGVAAVVEKWVNAIKDFVLRLKQWFSKNTPEIQGLRDVFTNEAFLSKISDKQAANNMAMYWKSYETLAQNITGINKNNFELTQDLGFISTISKDVRTAMDQILKSVPDVIKAQRDALERRIEQIMDLDFEASYFTIVDNIKAQAKKLKITPSLYLEVRRLRAAESKQVIDSVDPSSGKGLSKEGYINELKDILSNITISATTAWDIYTSDILDINRDVRIDYAGVAEEIILKEIKKRIIDYNTNLVAALKQNVIEDTGSPQSQYELTHGKYNKLLELRKEMKDLNLKENVLIDKLRKQQISSAISLFLHGKEVEWLGEKRNIPPLFKELEESVNVIEALNKKLVPLEEQLKVVEAEIAIKEPLAKAAGLGSLEDIKLQELIRDRELLKEDIKYFRPSSDQYAFLREKYDQFLSIWKSFGGDEVSKVDRVLSNLKLEDRQPAKDLLRDTKVYLDQIKNYLEKNQLAFLKEINDALNEGEDNTIVKNLTYEVEESVVDLSYAESILGARQNKDIFWAHIVSYLKRLGNKAKIALVDKEFNLKGVYDRNIEALNKNPIVQKYVSQLKTKNFKEIFHSIGKDGLRKHYLINPWHLDEFKKAQEAYESEIYQMVNLEMERLNMPVRLNLDDTAIAKAERDAILGVGQDLSLEDDPKLRRIRSYYRALQGAYLINFYAPKSDIEIEQIMAEKKAQLGEYKYKEWLKRVRVPVRLYSAKKGYTTKIVYRGELAVPAVNAQDDYVEMALFNEDGSTEPLVASIYKQDFRDSRFQELSGVPEFMEVYNEIEKMQLESYDKRRRPYHWDMVDAYQSGAFEGGLGDSIAVAQQTRLNDLGKIKTAAERIKDVVKSVYEINDEEKFILDKKRKTIPLRGVVAYEDPNRLADNYFDIISKLWYNVENYSIKTKGLHEMEALRQALKNRTTYKEQSFSINRWLRELVGYKTKDLDVREETSPVRWQQFIDNTFDALLYEEHTALGISSEEKVSKLTILAMKLPQLVSYLKVAGSFFSGLAAAGQGTYNVATLFASGRLFAYGDGNYWQKMKQRGKILYQYWKEERKAVALEYATNKLRTKTSLAQQFFGVSHHSIAGEGYESLGNRFLQDFMGFGLIAMANTRPFRMATRGALENLRWNSELNMWMNPEQFLRYRNNQEPLRKIEETEKEFKSLGVSVWDILEHNGTSLTVKAGHEDKLGLTQRANISSYLREIYGFVDNSLTDAPEITRSLVSKYLFALKKWIIRWQQELFYDRTNVELGTQDKSFLTYLTMALSAIFNKDSRKAIRDEFSHDYSARDIISRAVIMLGLEASLEQIASIFTAYASKLCAKDPDSWTCWASLLGAYSSKRTMAEVGGMYSITALVNNFDKPIMAFGTTYDILVDLVDIIDLPLDFVMSVFDDADHKVVNRGPYKDMSPVLANTIKLIPPARGTFEFFNNKALATRDQMITQQINREYVPLLGITEMYRILPTTYALNSFWQNAIGNESRSEWPNKITPKVKYSEAEK